jgi:cysteine desulfurase/selenocysteine lyase
VSFDPERIRGDFPALARSFRGRSPVYLDGACTSLRPEPVIEAVAQASRRGSGCVGRSEHRFAREAEEALAEARAAAARFVGAAASEVVFSRSTTDAINLVAAQGPWGRGDVVVTSTIEHNSNQLPWMRLARERGVEHRLHRIDVARGFDLQAFERDLPDKVALVALPLVSNLCGITLPAARIAKLVHARGGLLLLDAAQAATTCDLDVGALGADFLALSFHKMFGPAGIGLLWGRPGLLAAMTPAQVGGGTVDDVVGSRVDWSAVPDRFEAGVPDVEGAVGAAAAIDYLQGIGAAAIREHVVALNRRATEGLRRHRRLEIVGPVDAEARGGVLTFRAGGLKPEALARLLDGRENVMVRHGKLCAHTWFDREGPEEVVRASFSTWNTHDDVDRFVRTVSGALGLLG